ncbi:hypothetical protein FACS189483_09580 [Spirochaetia bacterium]|nr:hypothetical protein FACS189483_09580 [Spirochaetia bacterium]
MLVLSAYNIGFNFTEELYINAKTPHEQADKRPGKYKNTYLMLST